MGLTKLQRKLVRLAKIDLKKGLLAAGEVVAAEYRANVKVESGELKKNVRAWIKRGASGARNPEVRAGANSPYAKRIEFGYVGPDSLGRRFNQAAQPALRPAFRAKKPEALLLMRFAGQAWIKANIAATSST